MYLQVGCSAVLDASVMKRSKEAWAAYINTSATHIRDDYVLPINDTINYLGSFAGLCGRQTVAAFHYAV